MPSQVVSNLLEEAKANMEMRTDQVSPEGSGRSSLALNRERCESEVPWYRGAVSGHGGRHENGGRRAGILVSMALCCRGRGGCGVGLSA